MKTLLTYVLVASMGLVTTYSVANAQGERTDYVTSLASLPLENDDFVVDYDYTSLVKQVDYDPLSKKKQSLIYYINTTEVIEAAISHKNLVKYWKSTSWLSLNLTYNVRIRPTTWSGQTNGIFINIPDSYFAKIISGKDKLNGLFYQAINFRNARMNVQELKVPLEGKYEFSSNAKASIKLPLLKQEIGEYRYHSIRGAFAVFR